MPKCYCILFYTLIPFNLNEISGSGNFLIIFFKHFSFFLFLELILHLCPLYFLPFYACFLQFSHSSLFCLLSFQLYR